MECLEWNCIVRPCISQSVAPVSSLCHVPIRVLTCLPLKQLHYHLYHPSLPHLTPTHLSQHAHLMQTFFMSPQLREELQRKQEACYPASMLAPNRDLMLNDRYWGLVPLDKNPPNARNETISSRLYGWRSWLWRCTNDRDGKLYAVRRMEGEFADVRLGRASSLSELPPVLSRQDIVYQVRNLSFSSRNGLISYIQI